MRYWLRRIGWGFSGWTALAAAIVAIAIAAAALDYLIAAQLLGPHPQCRVEACADQEAWHDEAERRSEELAVRTWLYAGAVLAAVAAALARALRRRSPADRRTIFANLGSFGVALGVAHALLLWANSSSGIDGQEVPGWTVVVLLLVAAAAGGLSAHVSPAVPAAPAAEPRWRTVVGSLALGGPILTAATVVLVKVFAEQQPACGGSDVAPDWAEYLGWGAVGTSLGAAALGLVGLGARRWFLALVCLVVNPVALVYMVVSSCAFS